MSINFTSVNISSNPVNTNQTFILSVGVEPTTYERLKNWLHSQLQRFTHSNLKNDVLK